MNAPVKIACIQIAPFYRDVDANLEKAERYILEASANGANLLVLPEIFNVGSPGVNRQQAYEQAEPVPSGKTSQWMLKLAKENGVYICGSIIEVDGVKLYNTAILVGPEGFVGKFRKLHLCTHENYYYEPGDLGIPVFWTPIGRIAMLICKDTNFPETVRIAALQGADILLVPFAGGDWMTAKGYPEGMHTTIPASCMYNSSVNHIYIVGCNRTGNCNGYQSAGQSIITNAFGGISAPIAPYDKEIVLYAEVDLSESRRKGSRDRTGGYMSDRRTDLYDPMLGYDPKQFETQ